MILADFIKHLQELEKEHGGELPVYVFDEYASVDHVEAYIAFLHPQPGNLDGLEPKPYIEIHP